MMSRTTKIVHVALPRPVHASLPRPQVRMRVASVYAIRSRIFEKAASVLSSESGRVWR